LVSTNFVTAKYGVSEGGFNAESFSTVWTGAAALYALGILLLFGGREEILGIPRAAPLKTLILGLLTAAGMILTWAGLQVLDPAFCAFLWRFMPVLILLFGALFLGERVRIIELFPLVLMVAGGAYAAWGRWDIVGTGVILTLIAAVSGALQWVVAKLLVDRHKPDGVVFHRLASAAVFIVLWTLFTGRLDLNVPLKFWIVTLIGAMLGPVLAHVFTFRSYRYWGMSRSGMVLAAQPLFVLPMAFAFLGKTPVGKELIGGTLILVGAFGLAWMSMGGRKRTAARSDGPK
jgi:drug/metabolite transporter (DMT)-like permease